MAGLSPKRDKSVCGPRRAGGASRSCKQSAVVQYRAWLRLERRAHAALRKPDERRSPHSLFQRQSVQAGPLPHGALRRAIACLTSIPGSSLGRRGGVFASESISSRMHVRSRIFLVLRDREQAPFTDRDCEVMAILIPHLSRALKLQRDLGLIEFGRSAAFDALDNVALGIIIVDAEARIKFSNQAAQKIVDANDGLRFVRQRLMVEGGSRRNCDVARGDLSAPSCRVSHCRERRFRSLVRPGAIRIPCWYQRSGEIIFASGGAWSMNRLAIVYVRDPDRPRKHVLKSCSASTGFPPSQARTCGASREWLHPERRRHSNSASRWSAPVSISSLFFRKPAPIARRNWSERSC